MVEPLQREPDHPQSCLYWSNSTECDSARGKYPSLSINRHGTVVAVYNRGCVSLNMWCNVGKRKGNMYGKIEWGDSDNLGAGSHPTVSINDEGTVVVFHKSQWRRRLFYRVGKVNKEDLTIKWSTEFTPYSSGMRPAVALNNKGQVLVMHMTSTFGRFAIFYRVGTLKEDSTVKWSDFSRYKKGKRPQVALNDKGTVVEVHEQAPLNHAVLCAVGQIQSSEPITAEVKWGSMFIVGRGSNPHITVNNANQVVEVHEKGFRDVFYSGGVVYQQAKAIAGITECEIDKLCDGISPAVAMNDDGKVIFVCETSNPLRHTLLCHTGTWAED